MFIWTKTLSVRSYRDVTLTNNTSLSQDNSNMLRLLEIENCENLSMIKYQRWYTLI